MDISYYFIRLWNMLVSHGIPLASLLILAMLIPRIGRLAVRLISNRFDDNDEATKARLALVGALVYILEAIAYFALILLALTNLGISTMGAAVPATVVSAAVGFGSQKIIGDFLSGFFIISEKQFGVGDYVSFQGGGTPVEGTVVGLTLRATKIRTTAGELVTVPNGSATVVTNYSQDWARAVVTLPIPMDPDGSMGDLITDVERAARSAIASPEVSADVTDELEILPATNINQPTAAGLPWSVDFRIIVQVNPARQWAVERAIRTSLLDSFWHRYESIMLSSGDYNPVAEELYGIPTSASSVAPQRSKTTSFSASTSLSETTSQSTAKHAAEDTTKDTAKHAAEDAAENTAEDAAKHTDEDPTRTEDIAAFVAQRPQPEDPPTEIFDSPDSSPNSSLSSSSTTSSSSSQSSSQEKSDNSKGNSSLKESSAEDSAADSDSDSSSEGYYYDSRLKHWLSLRGRVRPSTTTLILVLLLLMVLNILSSDPEGGKAGILSPTRYTNSSKSPVAPAPAENIVSTPTVVEEAPVSTELSSSTPTTTPMNTTENAENTDARATEQSSESTGNSNSQSSAADTSVTNTSSLQGGNGENSSADATVTSSPQNVERNNLNNSSLPTADNSSPSAENGAGDDLSSLQGSARTAASSVLSPETASANTGGNESQ